MKISATVAGSLALLALSGGQALAQVTNVAQEGPQKAAAPEVAISDTDETVAKISAGAIMSTGNARSLALTAAASLRLRRGFDQYSGDIAANYGRASTTPGVPEEPTVENYQGRIRYDRFLARRWALFVQESARRDPFQDLDLRLNFDPGAAYYLIIEEKQHLTFEVGYDLQYDLREGAALVAAEAAGAPIAATEVRHAVRGFAGYDNALNEHVSLNTGLEYLQAFALAENFRLNWVTSVTAVLTDTFSLAAGFTLRYDNNPLPGVEKLDTLTTVSLVYPLK